MGTGEAAKEYVDGFASGLAWSSLVTLLTLSRSSYKLTTLLQIKRCTKMLYSVPAESLINEGETLSFNEELCKFFKHGEIKVISGVLEGASGTVVKVNGHVLTVLSDTTREHVLTHLSAKDVVRVIDGPLKGKQGLVAHIQRG